MVEFLLPFYIGDSFHKLGMRFICDEIMPGGEMGIRGMLGQVADVQQVWLMPNWVWAYVQFGSCEEAEDVVARLSGVAYGEGVEIAPMQLRLVGPSGNQ